MTAIPIATKIFCNETVAKTDIDEKYSYVFAILFGVPATIIILVTIIGNFMVLCFRARIGKSQTTLLIWNLGLADFFVGVFVLPIGVAYVIGQKWIFGRFVCKVWTSMDVVFCTASIVTLCFISLDRYIGVTRPLKYKMIVTKRRVIAAIVGIWIFSLGILLATVRYQSDVCIDATICLVSYELKYVVHSVVSAFFVPAAVTLVLYYKIFTVAKRREEGLRKGLMILTMNDNFFSACLTEPMRIHCGRDSVKQQEKVIQMHKKVAKTLGVVVSAFLICWVPFFATYIIDHHCECIHHIILDILTWLGYCNSMLNPIIYAFTVEDFKTSLKQLFSWSTYRNLNIKDPEFLLKINGTVPPPTPRSPRNVAKSSKSRNSPSSNLLRPNRQFLDLSQTTLASTSDRNSYYVPDPSMSNGEIQNETTVDEIVSSTADFVQNSNDDEIGEKSLSAKLYMMLISSKSTGV